MPDTVVRDACALADQDGDGVMELAVSEPGLRRVYVVAPHTGELLWEHRRPLPPGVEGLEGEEAEEGR